MDVVQLTRTQCDHVEKIMDACDSLMREWKLRKAYLSGCKKTLSKDAKQVVETLTEAVNGEVRWLRFTIRQSYEEGVSQDMALSCLKQMLDSDCLDYSEAKAKATTMTNTDHLEDT